MGLITFLSDFGQKDHYVAAVKAKVYSIDPTQRMIDITHAIDQFNIAHAAFVLKSVYNEFPEGTVHIIGVNSIAQSEKSYLGLELDGHYFLGADNGIFSLISNSKPTQIVRLKNQSQTLFPVKDILAPAACELANRGKLESLGDVADEINRMMGRELRLTDTMIMGNVIHVDHYGNLIVNIDIETFEAACAKRQFTIKFAREGVNKLNDTFNEVDEGDCCVVFNDLGLLEIAINRGNASQLLGLKYDSPVIVTFS